MLPYLYICVYWFLIMKMCLSVYPSVIKYLCQVSRSKAVVRIFLIRKPHDPQVSQYHIFFSSVASLCFLVEAEDYSVNLK